VRPMMRARGSRRKIRVGVLCDVSSRCIREQ
jgi:hypothetical protein